MGIATSFITFDGAGKSTGAGYTPDGTLPPGAVASTAAQAQDWPLWGLTGGALTAVPARTPTLAEQAIAAIGAGLTISLSGSITLAATLFPTDPATQGKLAAVMTAVNATGSFPGGATSYPMKDATAAWHTFGLAQYKAVAGAIAAYVAALDLIIDGNPTDATALPAASITLAV